MNNKICFITGANAGIGKEAAIQLAQSGFYVLMGSRNKERGLAAVNEVKDQSKLAQVMYTYWLAEKLSNTSITVNCIRVTNLAGPLCLT